MSAVERLPDGDLRIVSTEKKVRERIRDVGGRLVVEHGEALEPVRPPTTYRDPPAPPTGRRT